MTVVTDNSGPFRSVRPAHQPPGPAPLPDHVRSPGRNGLRESGFGALMYEKLVLDDITDGIELQVLTEAYRIDCNAVRPTRSCPGIGTTTPHRRRGPRRPSATFPGTNLCRLP